MLQVSDDGRTVRLTAKQVEIAFFPHPTMSEAIMEALHDLHGESIQSICIDR
jgi:dihydrolipoamide dehydrogenase